MKTYLKLSLLSVLAAALAFGQSATPSTTLSAAISATTLCIPFASNTNVLVGGGAFIELEYVTFTATPVGSACTPVRRGDVAPYGGPAVHPSGATAYIQVNNASGLGTGFDFTPISTAKFQGQFIRANIDSLPVIRVASGQVWDCPASPEAVTPYTCVWRLIYGPQTNLYGASQFISIPLTLTQLQTLNTVGVKVLPAYGANTWTEIIGCTLDLKRGSAAFTSGGTVTIGWGATSATTAAAATIASTVFTTFTASQSIFVAGALPVTADSLILNLPVWINAASADFATGTGATGLLDCSYRVHAGL